MLYGDKSLKGNFKGVDLGYIMEGFLKYWRLKNITDMVSTLVWLGRLYYKYLRGG